LEEIKMSEMVVVRSKIKEIAEGMNVSGDFADALNEEVVKLIKRACERAKENKRSTIQPRDL
jgi:histone H3/H4